MKMYLAGPMRGIPLYNFPAFLKMAERLRANGHEVFNPAESDLDDEGAETMTISQQEATNRMPDYMRRDTKAVLDMGAIAVLPGWETSSGARLEVALAHTCGFPVYDAESLTNGGAPRRIVTTRVTVEFEP